METHLQERLPNAAVLLAAYNGVIWLDEQLRSIQQQTGVCVHIYISVDLSSDGTEQYCTTYAEAHENVTLLPVGSVFGGAAKNFFRLMRDVDFSFYDIVALSDQDDIWNQDKLLRAWSIITQKGVDGYSSNVTAFWASGRSALINKAQDQAKFDHFFEAAGPGCTYVLTRNLASLVKRQIVLNWEAVQQVTLHDWYIYAISRSHQFKWHISGDSSLLYRQHESNQVGANITLVAYLARLKKIYAGWWLNQIQLIAQQAAKGHPERLPTWSQLGRGDCLYLVFHAWSCRRRLRDKCVFALVMGYFSIAGR